MPRPAEHTASIRAHLERLRAVGEDSPPLEEKCAILDVLRAEVPGGGRQIDELLITEAEQLRRGLIESKAGLRKLKIILEKVTAPPWQTALYLCPVDGGHPGDDLAGQRVMIYQGGSRRVVTLAEGVEAESFELGDEILLTGDGAAVIGRSPRGSWPVGETALFDRYVDDGRLVLRWRDEELVVDAAGPLRRVALQSGDQVRLDRATWIAYEKLARAAGRRYFLDEVPDARPEQVGGQTHNLRTLLAALTITLVAPDKAKLYGLSGRQTILMVGPPGCGKTLMARVAAAEIARARGKKCRFAVVKPSEWEDPYVGVTQQNIRNCFQALREAAAESFAVLFLDEIECVGRIRGSAVGHHSDKFLAALLAELDGFTGREGVAIISATNRKDLVDPALLERLSDVEVLVSRPDMRGAREIFDIHFPTSLPYSPNGEAAQNTRQELLDRAVSRLYAPNAENEVSLIKFRDGKTRTVMARELMSGRSIEQICRAARQTAFLRDVGGGEPGVRAEDVEEAVADAIHRLSQTVTPRNAHAYLADLPQDIDVVAVEPIQRRTQRDHRYFNSRQ